jgi:predicted peptidase
MTILILLLSACTYSGEAQLQPQSPLPSATSAAILSTPTEEPPMSALTPTVTVAPTRTPLPAIEEASILLGNHAYSFRSSSGEEVRFLLFLPDEYDPAVQWPLIVFFHGAGRRGFNIARLAEISLPELSRMREDFPFIVASPQLPSGFWPKYIDPMDELLEHLVDHLAIDEKRLYMTGFSIGSHGAWHYALRHPDRFAAIAPIAAGPSASGSEPIPEDICKLKDLPIWTFHSEADSTTSFELTEVVVEALEDCGADVRFTRYTDLSHGETAFDAYGDAELFDWFLEHTNQ